MPGFPPSLRFKPTTALALTARLFALLSCALLWSGTATGADPDPTEVESDTVPEAPTWSVDSPIGPLEYRVGRGLHFGRTGLHIGGFSTLEVDREEGDPVSFELDGLNFLVLFQPIESLRAFAELEIGHLFEVDTNSDHIGSSPVLDVERLYGDFSLNDRLSMRLGKFQTPVGRWNLVPAEPFVWTANEPVLVETAFDEHQTGGMFFGSFYPRSDTLTYSIYGQFFDPLDAGSTPPPVDHSVGGRLEYTRTRGPSLGASYMASERDGFWNHLAGLDSQWQLDRLELTTEFLVADGDIPGRDLWALYLQGVYEILPSFYLVGRYEHLDPASPHRDVDLADLGVAWIPVPYLHLKASYRVASRETRDVRRGLFTSLAVLF